MPWEMRAKNGNRRRVRTGAGEGCLGGAREEKFAAKIQCARGWACDGACGELAGTRTQDPRLKRALLYQLSYELPQNAAVSKLPQGELRVGSGRRVRLRRMQRRWATGRRCARG